MKNLFIKTLLVMLPMVVYLNDIDAQTVMTQEHTLNNKEQSIVSIAALTAKGNLPALALALNNGLNAGLTINEIKEILIQLSAYCGFPRSLNAINAFNAVVNERKGRGINDPVGTEPTAMSTLANKYETGKANLERLTGRAETGPKTGYAAFVPVIDTFLKEHLFADIFSRGVLTDQERELTTISALTSLGGVDAQLQGHLSISMHLGFSEPQLEQMLSIIERNIGEMQADAGREVLKKVIAARK